MLINVALHNGVETAIVVEGFLPILKAGMARIDDFVGLQVSICRHL